MPYAQIHGQRLYYEVRGEGPALVLIRGLSRSLRFWAPLRALLEPHFRVLVYDHRGIGRSATDGRGFGLADLARDLAGVMESAGLGRAHVFGLSMGGMVAQHLALDHAERVERLVLGATWSGRRSGVGPRWDTFAVFALAGRLPVRISIPVMAPRIVSPACVRARPEVVEEWVWATRGEEPSPRVVAAQVRAILRHETHRRLAALSVPTLVVTGNADRILPWVNSRILAEAIGGARLEVLEGVGHDFPAEAPERTADLLREFLTA